ncbi:MAG: SPASM domain-containing protein, partial [Nitrospinaceae bacterium]|nr:SPASM domain-containing protein [Nitrospinaceae bacterium]
NWFWKHLKDCATAFRQSLGRYKSKSLSDAIWIARCEMGSLIDEDLEAIWQNDKFNHFRENYRDTCGSCDLWVID